MKPDLVLIKQKIMAYNRPSLSIDCLTSQEEEALKIEVAKSLARDIPALISYIGELEQELKLTREALKESNKNLETIIEIKTLKLLYNRNDITGEDK